MKKGARVCVVLAYLWIGLVVLYWLGSGVVYTAQAESWTDALSRLVWVGSAFHVGGLVGLTVLGLPALGLAMLAGWLERRDTP